ncbi:MAG: hypothetical protein JNK15_19805, partial [Planctomycetes bacterium]|nr:hypothetical protein [Planctomycetota bacterium]
AEVLAADGSQAGSFRILTHTSSELVLSTESGAFPGNAAKVRVRAKFFDVMTGGNPGLGATYLGASGARIPVSNVRIGFAFHQDPSNPAAQRFPAQVGTFVYDLSDPAVQTAIRDLHMPFVQWDVLFDNAFQPTAADQPPALTPDTGRPELHFLRLPFRF